MTTKAEREKFVAVIQQHAGGEPTQRHRFAQRLMRYGATYGRMQEKPQDVAPAKEAKIIKAIEDLCHAFNCWPVFSGDFRGDTLTIEVRSGERVGVPTSRRKPKFRVKIAL